MLTTTADTSLHDDKPPDTKHHLAVVNGQGYGARRYGTDDVEPYLFVVSVPVAQMEPSKPTHCLPVVHFEYQHSWLRAGKAVHLLYPRRWKDFRRKAV